MIENAKITDTMLGIEDHGIMTCFIFCEFENGVCGFGGYSLDGKPVDGIEKNTIKAIRQILEVVGVDTWEQLKGKNIRVEHSGLGGSITRIGNIIKDKWFSFKDYFDEEGDNL